VRWREKKPYLICRGQDGICPAFPAFSLIFQSKFSQNFIGLAFAIRQHSIYQGSVYNAGFKNAIDPNCGTTSGAYIFCRRWIVFSNDPGRLVSKLICASPFLFVMKLFDQLTYRSD
jgi:hypothetical protein